MKKHPKKKISMAAVLAVILFLLAGLAVGFYINRGRVEVASEQTEASRSIVESDPESIPAYAGSDYVILNNDKPCFNAWDLENITGEHYSELDRLGRCGAAVALLHETMMPKAARGEIGQVRPSGWKQTKYEGLIDADPPFLYNRSHLIAYALTGQNDNERNLITGTRYMNTHAMLPWEETVMRYLNDSGNHVLYRVTPYFRGNELLARGVEMEAYSVEDQGSLSYHVFVYNIQPGVKLNYATGDSTLDKGQ